MPIPRFPIRSRIDGRLVHPGAILRDCVMWEYDVAIELEEALGFSAHFWLALQADYDIETLRMRPARKPAKGRRPLPELGPSEPLEDPVQTTYDAIGNRSIDPPWRPFRNFERSFRLASWRGEFFRGTAVCCMTVGVIPRIDTPPIGTSGWSATITPSS